jgi:hypothetical protein
MVLPSSPQYYSVRSNHRYGAPWLTFRNRPSPAIRRVLSIFSRADIGNSSRLVAFASHQPPGRRAMALYLDHAYITCSIGAPEAEVLLEHGFAEGSPNVHPGQGTANRRFFFANFMLELLWVADPVEAAADAVRHTGLWERWSSRGEGTSRFGIVYGGVPAPSSQLPFTTRSYHAAYLPPPMSIEIVQGLTLVEPALFWIPSLRVEGPKRSEPINHVVAVRSVTRIVIGLPRVRSLSEAARRVREAGLLDLVETPTPVLEVHFQGLLESSIDCRPGLPLVFVATA